MKVVHRSRFLLGEPMAAFAPGGQGPESACPLNAQCWMNREPEAFIHQPRSPRSTFLVSAD